MTPPGYWENPMAVNWQAAAFSRAARLWQARSFAKSLYLGTDPQVDHAFMQESAEPSRDTTDGYLWWLWGDDVFSAIGILAAHLHQSSAGFSRRDARQ